MILQLLRSRNAPRALHRRQPPKDSADSQSILGLRREAFRDLVFSTAQMHIKSQMFVYVLLSMNF